LGFDVDFDSLTGECSRHGGKDEKKPTENADQLRRILSSVGPVSSRQNSCRPCVCRLAVLSTSKECSCFLRLTTECSVVAKDRAVFCLPSSVFRSCRMEWIGCFLFASPNLTQRMYRLAATRTLEAMAKSFVAPFYIMI
jgi:hypothetical protein